MKSFAIIGRTNVGKSTLFNRFLSPHQKPVLTMDVSATTRDFHHCICSDSNGKSFKLIDTAGLFFSDKDAFKKTLTTQTCTTIKDSFGLILVCDGRFGIHPEDNDVINFLRKEHGKKNIWLVINKMDDPSKNYLSDEFYSLGIEKIFKTSCEHNIGIEDLKKQLFNTVEGEGLPNVQINQPSHKIAIIGVPNAGKSTLMNAILGKKPLSGS